MDGLANLAANAVRIELLHVPAGPARLVGNAWHGGGAVNGLTALFWEPGRAQVALAVDQAIDGDFRAAAASTVEAVGVGVATGIALGELGAAAVDAVRSVPSGPTIKTGDAGGPTAGQRFPESIRDETFTKDPTKTCVYCGQPGTGTQVDHATPRARGGNSTSGNAQLACPHCNASKGARDFPKTPPAGYKGPWPPPHWQSR